MKWGYNDGRRNGKRTAGEGESYLDLLERAGDTPSQYEFNGKTYKLSDYEEYAGGGGRAQYTYGNHKIWVKSGSSWKDKKYSTRIDANSSITHIEEGKLKRYKREVSQWFGSLRDHKITFDGKSHVEKGKISKAIDKGKKKVNKFLNKIKNAFKPKPKKAKVTTGRLTAYKNDF